MTVRGRERAASVWFGSAKGDATAREQGDVDELLFAVQRPSSTSTAIKTHNAAYF